MTTEQSHAEPAALLPHQSVMSMYVYDVREPVRQRSCRGQRACGGASGTCERAGRVSTARSQPSGAWPRATSTAAPTMWRIWWSMKEDPCTVTCAPWTRVTAQTRPCSVKVLQARASRDACAGERCGQTGTCSPSWACQQRRGLPNGAARGILAEPRSAAHHAVPHDYAPIYVIRQGPGAVWPSAKHACKPAKQQSPPHLQAGRPAGQKRCRALRLRAREHAVVGARHRVSGVALVKPPGSDSQSCQGGRCEPAAGPAVKGND